MGPDSEHLIQLSLPNTGMLSDRAIQRGGVKKKSMKTVRASRFIPR
jgi:hypothetical protein